MLNVFTCKEFKDVNAFLIYNNEHKAILFDTAYLAYQEIIDFVKARKIEITDIFITHGHFPHFYGLNEICKTQNNPNVYIGLEDLNYLFDSEKNMSEFFEGVQKFILRPLKNLKVIAKNEDLFQINGYDVQIFKKVSHTEGSLIFVIPDEKLIFSGDFIFKDGDYVIDGVMQLDDEEKKNGKEIFNWLITEFDCEYLIYPGHYEYGFKIKNILEDEEGELLKKYIND